jgi:MurNAc alpha-1-phosphate uridylyltransferase
MKFIDYGLNVLCKLLFDNYKVNVVFDSADLYHLLSIQHQLAGLEVNEKFYEIGSHQGIN